MPTLIQLTRCISWLSGTAIAGVMFICLTACNSSNQSIAPATSASGDLSEVTFCRDVAPIVFARCAPCHRPGEAAPFSLLTYDDVRRRASQIGEVTKTGFMPPWLPREGHGEFADSRRLSRREIETFAAWAAAGASRGDEADLPAPPEFSGDWQLGPPDLVLESPRFTVAGDGADRFRNFVIPVNIDSPRWISAVELRPTNPVVTHHARLGIDSSYESVRRDAADDEPGYEGMAWGEDPEGQLAIWAPGMTARRGLPGAAWRLQPRTSLVLHTHLQPTGKTESAEFRVGLHFATGPPTVRPVILRIGSRDIDIPAGAPRHFISDEYELPIDVDVHSIFPHAHSLCQEIRVRAELPNGARVPLLWIENFDENWHDQYHYRTSVRLPRGTKLITESTYDNTESNIRNRNRPPKRTVYGSNAADEMQDVYLQVTAVRPDERAALWEDFQQGEQRSLIVGHRKTLEAHPDDPWALEGLAAGHFAQGNAPEAIRLLEDRLQLGPAEIHSLAILGMAHFAAGDYPQAEQLQRQAIAIDDQYAFAWLGLGKALVAQRRFDESTLAFRRAVKLAPALTDAHLALANLHVQQDELEEAAAACQAAVTSSPAEPNAYLKMAEIRARQGRFDDSLQLLTEARRLAPYIHPPKVLLAVNLFQIGEVDRARTLLAEARAEAPNHPVPPLFLGQIARAGGQPADARRHLEAAASLPLPANWPASHRKRSMILLHSERLRLAEQLQDEVLARDAFEQWLKWEPENDQLRRMYENFRSTGR
jgi:tetratricopeptide (TPR) repeat protein